MDPVNQRSAYLSTGEEKPLVFPDWALSVFWDTAMLFGRQRNTISNANCVSNEVNLIQMNILFDHIDTLL